MKRLALLLLFATTTLLRAAEATPPAPAPAAPDPLEAQVAALVAGPQVTIVHFWAPWCPNCREELLPDGWKKFTEANPGVKVVFINIWHKGQDPAPRLKESGLGAQPNLLLLNHPNPSRLAEKRLNSFLGQPLTWIPATWVYGEGKLRVAFNYGEIRFPVLQQMVDDARHDWDHK